MAVDNTKQQTQATLNLPVLLWPEYWHGFSKSLWKFRQSNSCCPQTLEVSEDPCWEGGLSMARPWSFLHLHCSEMRGWFDFLVAPYVYCGQGCMFISQLSTTLSSMCNPEGNLLQGSLLTSSLVSTKAGPLCPPIPLYSTPRQKRHIFSKLGWA